MDPSTIAAIATPIGSGGIGIVKLSGNDAFTIACAIFRRFGSRFAAVDSSDSSTNLPVLFPGIFYGHIIDPESKKVIDEVLLMVMPGPKSHTREDVVEIHMHAGVVAIHLVLDLVLKQGARLAQPGEFTQRAFLNGRIDLTQAEAVIDMVNAKNSMALSWAANQMGGALKSVITSALETLLDLRARVEATIDFPDETHDALHADHAVHHLKSFVAEPLHRLLEHYDRTHLLREGIKTVIVGKPNVGKSSLLNRLLKKDRAIVSPLPGTTRDYIEAQAHIQQVSVVLIDTAGIHRTVDVIENIGIQKAFEHIEAADLVLFVVDISRPLTTDDSMISEQIRHKEKILVMNKADLCDDVSTPRVFRPVPFIGTVAISALHGHGIDALENLMFHFAQGNASGDVEMIGLSPNLRHKIAIEKSLDSVHNAIAGLSGPLMAELLVLDLKDAIRPLEEILGKTVSPDVLEMIFSRFCIGK